jgi:protein gp37
VSDRSAIEWTDATWNPTTGCAKVSPGCAHCYIEHTPAFRIAGRRFEQGHIPLQLHPDRLEQPLHWRTPRRVFVNSLSDLFHDDLHDEFIDRVFAVMALSPWHTYQVLTKRAERMRAYLNGLTFERVRIWMNRAAVGELTRRTPAGGFVPTGAENLTTIARRTMEYLYRFEPDKMPRRTYGPPFPNVWLGVTVENQRFADERIPLLLQTPAALRFISAEPLLGPLRLDHMDVERFAGDAGYYCINALTGRNRDMGRPCRDVPRVDWIIVGGESGSGARPFNLAWARSILQQCQTAGVPCFVKQLGARPTGRCTLECAFDHTMRFADRKAGDPAEWPADLRVREFPSP